jgi:hypothetical protein
MGYNPVITGARPLTVRPMNRKERRAAKIRAQYSGSAHYDADIAQAMHHFQLDQWSEAEALCRIIVRSEPRQFGSLQPSLD